MAEKKAAEKGSKKAPKKGDKYQCGVCGLVVMVDEPCNCVEACDIICCGQEMAQKS